jgi:AraC family transcriptional regulator
MLEIEACPHHDWTLEELASRAATSPFHFIRVFRSHVGQSPLRYVRTIRLARAAAWLRYTDRPVTDIAFASGYDTHSGFTRAFTDHHRCSPTEYRRRFFVAPWVLADPDLPGTTRSRAAPRTADSVRIVPMNARRVAFFRHFGSYLTVPFTWIRLLRWVEQTHVSGPLLGISYEDSETGPVGRTRYDAGIVVPEDLALSEDVGEQFLEAGLFAVYDFRGSILRMLDAWRDFTEGWLPQSGYVARDLRGFDLFPSHLLEVGRLRAIAEMTFDFEVSLSVLVGRP